MKSRILPLVNGIGCLLLTAVIVVQWGRERAQDQRFSKLRVELQGARAELEAERKRTVSLERDLAVLKESVEATQQAAEAAARELAVCEEAREKQAGELASARAQVEDWQKALAVRDEKIRELGDALEAARARLELAVARLKEAGAR